MRFAVLLFWGLYDGGPGNGPLEQHQGPLRIHTASDFRPYSKQGDKRCANLLAARLVYKSQAQCQPAIRNPPPKPFNPRQT